MLAIAFLSFRVVAPILALTAWPYGDGQGQIFFALGLSVVAGMSAATSKTPRRW